ncbi:MAG: SIS domain-containing protein [Nitrospiraceae bacterium]|jgi:D-sedoheptulose 7-phosphate isomerase|nr:SIS domain-containing protein [Nitrospira sp.]MDW7649158.1 SIS domain-containing protein [Nitrospiraceae bacterium]GBL40065.1 phosphoheptose isomerase [Nitrospirota bacterium]MBP0122022.1 SIS domain-containing protein [Nitrospira sp.]MBP0124389.1 SIS domain-containing protein [Nitrospira sp.]
MKELALSAFAESATVKQQFARDHVDRIVQVATLMAMAFREGHKVLLFGNGGSATDAAHLAAEFVGRYKRERAPLPAIALATDIAAITCIANDYGYDELFARQIRAHGQNGDVAIAISTSGNSPNVLKGVEAAKACGLITVGWTGGTGGKLAGLVDHSFVVPSAVTARIQESHITLGHVLCELIEEQLLGKVS